MTVPVRPVPVECDKQDRCQGAGFRSVGLSLRAVATRHPATADLMAKLANGHANDLASTVLLATDKQVLMAPAMNPRMWAHPATRRNHATLIKDGVAFVGPARGEMAESGEAGEGRMAEPLEIVAAIEARFDDLPKPLAGRKIIVTSGKIGRMRTIGRDTELRTRMFLIVFVFRRAVVDGEDRAILGVQSLGQTGSPAGRAPPRC